MDTETAIKVENVSKSFRLPHEKNSSLKSLVVNFWRRKKGYEDLEVLKDISFEIKRGEFFGIVGRNGSGKSTLLKLLAGIYTPSQGSVRVNGKLTPFIELGVGFNPELTGKENVFLNGALLGFSRKEMAAMYKDIVDFAELGKFMDQKLKNYSSGMQVRLAFSVAIRANTDILLIDEVLAVGDQNFQEKCFEYFANVKHSGKTVVFVTHDMSNVERFCDKVFVIDKKRSVNGLYSIPEAVSIYNRLNHEKPHGLQSSTLGRARNSDLYIEHVELQGKNGKPVNSFQCGSPLRVCINIASKRPSHDQSIVIGLAFHDKDGNNLSGPNSGHYNLRANAKQVIYQVNKIPFNMGEYYLTVALFNANSTQQYDIIDKGITFFVNTDEVYHGRVILEGTWTAEN